MKPFAKVSEVKEGTVLITDGGFTCLKEGEKVIVEKDNRGLFVKCCKKEGDYGAPKDNSRTQHHYLDGQLASENHTLAEDEEDTYVGLYMEE